MEKRLRTNSLLKLGLALLTFVFLTIFCVQMGSAMESHVTDNHFLKQMECSHGNCEKQIQADLHEGYQGACYNIQPPIVPVAFNTLDSCNTVSTSHGTGRENGCSSSFLSTGCRQYKGFPYTYTYGTTNIPYFINTTDMTTTQANEIRNQVESWNQAIMHDGTGQIVKLYEATNLNPIGGRQVCEILLENLNNYDGNGSNAAGLFYPSPYYTLQIKLHNGGYNSDTPMHETGHLLGLWDLDENGVTSHRTLMSYNRVSKGIAGQLQYQDIQGISLINNRHTCTNSHKMRYIQNGNNYLHFCFYCDRVDSQTSIISGSAAMLTATTCTHTYQKMVSYGERHWLKCTKCYKVVESEFMVQGLTSTTLKITGLINTDKTLVTIPSSIDGQAITSIGSLAFSDCTKMSQIEIPASVKYINSGAFQNCTKLATVIFSNTSQLQIVDSSAFSNCTQLSQITIPSSVMNIGNYAFYNCRNLRNIYFGANSELTRISSNAFSQCINLTEIILPSGVTSIGDRAFDYCIGLSEIIIPSSVTSIENDIFNYCKELRSVVFDKNIKTSIGKDVFNGCGNLEEVYFGDNSEITFDKRTFVNCGKDLVITFGKNSIAYISGEAFESSCDLKELYFGTNSKAIIGYCAFSDLKSLVSVNFGANSESNIGKYAFWDCIGLESVSFGANSTASIGNSAFFDCAALTNITLPDIVSLMSTNVFIGTAVWNNAPDNSLIYADGWVLGYKGTISGSITLTEGTRGIAGGAFMEQTELTSIVIPQTVSIIGDYAFMSCIGLTEINIPNSVVRNTITRAYLKIGELGIVAKIYK